MKKADKVHIQWDIDRLQKWVVKWLVEFNPSKFEVLIFVMLNIRGNI